ncbi:MAG: hypothetical protein F4X64_01090 [Chloroflexi bacterium]|nr:hypothetical protein [Chloroflexota bacterium]
MFVRLFFIAVIFLIAMFAKAQDDQDCLILAPLPWWMLDLPDENFESILTLLEDSGVCTGTLPTHVDVDFGSDPENPIVFTIECVALMSPMYTAEGTESGQLWSTMMFALSALAIDTESAEGMDLLSQRLYAAFEECAGMTWLEWQNR